MSISLRSSILILSRLLLDISSVCPDVHLEFVVLCCYGRDAAKFNLY